METNTPIRFAVDENVVGLLALATRFSKHKFLTIVEDSEDLYEKLLWTDGLLQSEKIEFVVTYNAYQELIKDKNVTPSVERVLPQKRIEQIERSNLIRKYSRIYMHECPGIKIPYATNGIKSYKDDVLEIAEQYSEMPACPENLAYSHSVKEKPYLRLTTGTITKDTFIMAEATLMGLNLITTNFRHLAVVPYNVRENVKKLNQQLFNSNVTALSLDEFFENVMSPYSDTLQINTEYVHPENPQLVQMEFYKRQDYIDHITQIFEENKEYWAKRRVAVSRTACRNFLEKPLDLSSLTPENLDIDAEIANAGLTINPETNILEPMPQPVQVEPENLPTNTIGVKKPRLLKSKNATTRIKFDFNSPDANYNLNEFFKSLKKQNNNLEDEPTL